MNHSKIAHALFTVTNIRAIVTEMKHADGWTDTITCIYSMNAVCRMNTRQCNIYFPEISEIL
jgi:hypothetical protein